MDPPPQPVKRARLATIHSRLEMYDRTLTRMMAQNHEEMAQLTKHVMSLEDSLATTRAALEATRANGGFMSPNAHRVYMGLFDCVDIEAIVEAFNNQWLPNYARVKKESETWKFENWDDNHERFFNDVTYCSTMTTVRVDPDAGGIEDIYGQNSKKVNESHDDYCTFALRPCKSIKLMQDPYDIGEYELSIHEFVLFGEGGGPNGEEFVGRPASRAFEFKDGKLELDAKKFWQTVREMVVEMLERV